MTRLHIYASLLIVSGCVCKLKCHTSIANSFKCLNNDGTQLHDPSNETYCSRHHILCNTDSVLSNHTAQRAFQHVPAEQQKSLFKNVTFLQTKTL